MEDFKRVIDTADFMSENLKHYDKILLFLEEEVLKKFYFSEVIANLKKKVLVLSEKSISINSSNSNITMEKIDRIKIERLLSLYFLYEFSDQFFVISEQKDLFNGLWNLSKAGILSYNEIYDIILGD